MITVTKTRIHHTCKTTGFHRITKMYVIKNALEHVSQTSILCINQVQVGIAVIKTKKGVKRVNNNRDPVCIKK